MAETLKGDLDGLWGRSRDRHGRSQCGGGRGKTKSLPRGRLGELEDTKVELPPGRSVEGLSGPLCRHGNVPQELQELNTPTRPFIFSDIFL